MIAMKREKVAVLGLGAMGSRMASRLVEAGHDVVVYNRTAAATEPLVAAGARCASHPRTAVVDRDVVISCVRDDDAARAVWLDLEHGGLLRMKPGSTLIESSTLTPACVGELAARARARGVRFLDAPVVGTRPHAETGQLIYLVGGDAAALSHVLPLLAVLGAAVHHVGETGAGATMKLAVNALFAIQVAAFAELLAVAKRSGVASQTVIEVLGVLPVTSRAAIGAASLMVSGDHAPMFPVDLVVKDLGYAEALAQDTAIEPVLMASARGQFARARAAGRGRLNITAVAELFSD